jgi:metal-responsive CopG/Arc/MetJ family transcriptional regulator
MRVVVLIPDRISRAADRTARRLKVSRSELDARALSAFMEGQDDREVTERLDGIYAQEPSSLDSILIAPQEASITKKDW